MAFQQLVAILPCHSFDDFPFHLEGVSADEVLSAYTALWHPALIADTGHMPTWRGNADEQPWDGCLVTLPQSCQDDMPGYWLEEIRGQGGVVLPYQEASGRDGLVAAALQEADQLAVEIEPSLLADFFALGLCHLLTEVLTVRMRYTSLLDEARFNELCVDAANTAVAGNLEETRAALGRCFDALAESKDHFYPVDSFLIDLTLSAPTTLGSELAGELAGDVASNLLISADDIQQMASEHPETLNALRAAISSGHVALIGGEPADDAPLPLMTADEIVDRLQQGLQTYQRYLDARPVVFGRRQFGLSPVLPQLLTKSGFTGALHFSLDGNRFPESYHNTIEWQSADGSRIHALARPPLDAQRAESILSLPQSLGDAMDNDHVVAVCFAHWPGHVSPWYRDLQRVEKYAAVLGKFVTVETFFESSSQAVETTQNEADEYRLPYLRQSASSGSAPISTIVERTRRHAEKQGERTVGTLATLLQSAVDAPGDAPGGAPGGDTNPSTAIDRLSATLPRSGDSQGSGYLIVNPYSAAQQVVVPTPLLENPPRVEGDVLAAHEKSGRREVLVEVPPLGYVALHSDTTQSWTVPSGKPMAEDHLLRNEHFEVRINAETGAVQSVHNLRQRGNVLSQRLAMRLPVAGRHANAEAYSVMAADSVQVCEDGPLTAALTSHGRLLDRSGELLARFDQTIRVERSRPILYFDVQLDPVALPQGNPWQSYYAARFAWSSAGAEAYRSIGLAAHPTNRSRVESPHYIDLRGGPTRITMLTGGLPYHLLHDNDRLDSLLVVPGEPARRFRFAVGFELKQPAVAALSWLAPPLVSDSHAPGVAPSSSWLFHIDARNVIATHWEPLATERTAITGVRLRLQEVAGRPTKVRLRSFRELASARKLDFVGQCTSQLQPQGDHVMIELSAYECCTVESEWQDDRDD